MLDIKYVRNNIDEVRKSLINRNNSTEILDVLIELDEKRRILMQSAQELRAERNESSKKVSVLMKEGKKEEASELIEKSKEVGDKIKNIEEELKTIDDEYNLKLLYIPNMPDSDVKVGKDESENVELRKWGEPKNFDFEPIPHWEFGVSDELLDFDRGSKLSGSRFTVLKGDIARLERALMNFMMNTHSSKGYTEVLPPHLVTRETITSTGQLPKFEDDLYSTKDDMFLIPTAEVTLVGMHRNEIIEKKDLPLTSLPKLPASLL